MPTRPAIPVSGRRWSPGRAGATGSRGRLGAVVTGRLGSAATGTCPPRLAAMCAARTGRCGDCLVRRLVAWRAPVVAAAWCGSRAGCETRRGWAGSRTARTAGGVTGTARLGSGSGCGSCCGADAAGLPSRAAIRAGRGTGDLACAGSAATGRGDGGGVAAGAAAGASDGTVVDTGSAEAAEAAGADATAAVTGAAGSVGVSPVVGVAGGGTGDDTASDGGAVETRAGRNPAGSRYPSSSVATRIPRWTYGVATSGSPLGPIVPTGSPSATAAPFVTTSEPRCVSVTA